MSTAGNYNPNPCQWCNMHHIGKCPMIKAIEYFADGSVKRVEFHGPQPLTAADRPFFPPLSGSIP